MLHINIDDVYENRSSLNISGLFTEELYNRLKTMFGSVFFNHVGPYISNNNYSEDNNYCNNDNIRTFIEQSNVNNNKSNQNKVDLPRLNLYVYLKSSSNSYPFVVTNDFKCYSMLGFKSLNKKFVFIKYNSFVHKSRPMDLFRIVDNNVYILFYPFQSDYATFLFNKILDRIESLYKPGYINVDNTSNKVDQKVIDNLLGSQSFSEIDLVQDRDLDKNLQIKMRDYVNYRTEAAKLKDQVDELTNISLIYQRNRCELTQLVRDKLTDCMNRIPFVDKIALYSKGFLVKMNKIKVFYMNKNILLGDFVFIVPFDMNRSIGVYNNNWVMRDDRIKIDHPHSLSNICFGDDKTQIKKYTSELDYYNLILMLHSWAVSYNHNSAYTDMGQYLLLMMKQRPELYKINNIENGVVINGVS